MSYEGEMKQFIAHLLVTEVCFVFVFFLKIYYKRIEWPKTIMVIRL